jgi:hypothetical protein
MTLNPEPAMTATGRLLQFDLVTESRRWKIQSDAHHLLSGVYPKGRRRPQAEFVLTK